MPRVGDELDAVKAVVHVGRTLQQALDAAGVGHVLDADDEPSGPCYGCREGSYDPRMVHTLVDMEEHKAWFCTPLCAVDWIMEQGNIKVCVQCRTPQYLEIGPVDDQGRGHKGLCTACSTAWWEECDGEWKPYHTSVSRETADTPLDMDLVTVIARLLQIDHERRPDHFVWERVIENDVPRLLSYLTSEGEQALMEASVPDVPRLAALLATAKQYRTSWS